MKYAILPILFFTQLALACPDLAGEYEFESPITGGLIVTQSGCEWITIKFTNNDYTATLLPDGKPYEKSWNKMNSKSSIPATAQSTDFDVAHYSATRFVWKTHNGLKSACDGTYSFTSFECKLFEHSLGYNPDVNAFTWTQIGWWRGADGSYAQDEFVLRKVR